MSVTADGAARMTRWADICCGSGALTLELLSYGTVEPPAAYLGGKRAYARHIVQMMGGWERPSSVVLCDAGPWGAWWWLVLADGQGDRVVDAVAHLDQHRHQGADLHRWLSETPAVDAVEQAAAFIALQASAARGKPVLPRGDGTWRTPGYAHLSKSSQAKGFPERLRPLALAERLRVVFALDWPPVTVVYGDAALVDPAGGRVVIDAPYRDTAGYGHDLERPRLLDLARRHADAGAVVGVCEAEPLADGLGEGWHVAEVERDGWQKRLSDVREWFTINRPPQATEDRGAMLLDLGYRD